MVSVFSPPRAQVRVVAVSQDNLADGSSDCCTAGASKAFSALLGVTVRFIYIYVDFTHMWSWRWDPGCRRSVCVLPPWGLPWHRVETRYPLFQLHSIHSSTCTRTDGPHSLSINLSVALIPTVSTSDVMNTLEKTFWIAVQGLKWDEL